MRPAGPTGIRPTSCPPGLGPRGVNRNHSARIAVEPNRLQTDRCTTARRRPLPADRQNLLFSATILPEIQKLTQSLLNNPIRIDVTPKKDMEGEGGNSSKNDSDKEKKS